MVRFGGILVGCLGALQLGTARAQDRMDNLNAALGSVAIDLPLGEIEDTTQRILLTDIKVSFPADGTISCSQLRLNDLEASQGPLPTPIDVDGESYDDGLEWQIDVRDFSLRCELPFSLCFRTCPIFGGCGGVAFSCNPVISEVTVNSLSDGIDVTLSQQVLGPDFSQSPPTFARETPATCESKVNTESVQINIVSGSLIGFQAGDDFVLGLVEGLAKDELRSTLCETTSGLIESLNQVMVPNISSISTPVDVTALAFERELFLNAPDEVEIVNLWDNRLLNLLLDFFPSLLGNMTLPGSDSLPGGDGSGGNELNTTALLTSLESVLDLLNITGLDLESLGLGGNSSTANPLALIDLVLGTNLTETVDFEQLQADLLNGLEVDLIVLASAFSENATNSLAIDNFTLPGIGVASGELTSLILAQNSSGIGSTNATSAESGALGDISFVLPVIELGDLSVRVGLSLQLEASVDLLGSPVVLTFDETFTTLLGWDDFSAQAAVLLALDGASIKALELGQLAKLAGPECVGLIIYFLGLSATQFNGALDLEITGFFDALLDTLANIVNILSVPLRFVVLPLIGDVLQDSLTSDLLPEPDCPTAVLDANTEQLIDLSDNAVLLAINNLLSIDSVGSLIDVLIGNNRSLPEIGSLEEFDFVQLLGVSSVELFTAELPQAPGDEPFGLTVSASGILLTDVIPPSGPGAELNLLNSSLSGGSAYVPQGIYSAVQTGSAGVAVTLQIETSQGESNVVTVRLSFDALRLAVDIFAAYRVYDVESMPVGNALNLDCWVARLQPYGGIKEVLLELVRFGLSIDCVQCPNVVLLAWSQLLEDPAAADDLSATINGALQDLTQVIPGDYKPGAWEDTIAAAAARCEGLPVPVSGSSSAAAQVAEQDLSVEYAFVGAFFAAMCMAGLFTCGCSVGPKRRKSVAAGNGSAVAVAVIDDESKGGKQDGEALPAGAPVTATKTPSKCEEADELESAPLFRHPLIPKITRILMPLILVGNLGLFVVGHVVKLLRTDIVAQVLGYPVTFQAVAELSAIDTVKDLFESGSYFLTFLLCGFSIVWPYVKLIGVALCWFLPTHRLSFSSRGFTLLALDQLGKWSLVELYFVAFVNVVLNINIDSPEDSSTLPPGLYMLGINIEPQFTLYTFTVALLLSIAASNVALAQHDHVQSHVLRLRRAEVGTSSKDTERYSLQSYLAHGFALSRAGALIVAIAVIAVLGLVLFACTMPVLEIRIYGLARPLIELAGDSSVTEYSLFSFISSTFGSTSPGQLFFGVCFVATVLLFPVLQLLSLVLIPFLSFSTKSAERFMEVSRVLSAWSALEVLVLAVAGSTLELETVSSFIVEDSCDFLLPLFTGLLEPAGVLDARDIQSTCFGLEASISYGAFVFFASLILTSLVHLFVIKLFQEYLKARQQLGLVEDKADNTEMNCSAKLLLALGLVHKADHVSPGTLNP